MKSLLLVFVSACLLNAATATASITTTASTQQFKSRIDPDCQSIRPLNHHFHHLLDDMHECLDFRRQCRGCTIFHPAPQRIE